MLGVSWNAHEITVSIPSSPLWASNALKTAISDWEAAQRWFIESYFPDQTNAQFTFVPTTNGTHLQVKIEYVTDEGQYWTGNTEVPVSGPVTNETVLLVLSRLPAPGDVTQVTLHELGHVLGLDHTAYSQDLMYPAMDAYSGGEPVEPSTVNLYGVYMLGEGCDFSAGQAAVMPPWIPYLEWSPGIQQASVNPHSTSSTNPCSAQVPFWNQPWFTFPALVGLITAIAVIINFRRKKTLKPTKSVPY